MRCINKLSSVPHILWKSHCQSCLLGKITYRIAQFAWENTKQDFCCQICSLKYDYNNYFLQLRNLLSSISRTYYSNPAFLFFLRSHVGQCFVLGFVLTKLYCIRIIFICAYRKICRIYGGFFYLKDVSICNILIFSDNALRHSLM